VCGSNRGKSLLGLLILLAAQPAFAHHSFAAEFEGTQPVTLKGSLTKMEWVIPHGWVYADVKGDDGNVVNWAVETGGPNALISPPSFPSGAA
jgi:hypothetical protein